MIKIAFRAICLVCFFKLAAFAGGVTVGVAISHPDAIQYYADRYGKANANLEQIESANGELASEIGDLLDRNDRDVKSGMDNILSIQRGRGVDINAQQLEAIWEDLPAVPCGQGMCTSRRQVGYRPTYIVCHNQFIQQFNHSDGPEFEKKIAHLITMVEKMNLNLDVGCPEGQTAKEIVIAKLKKMNNSNLNESIEKLQAARPQTSPNSNPSASRKIESAKATEPAAGRSRCVNEFTEEVAALTKKFGQTVLGTQVACGECADDFARFRRSDFENQKNYVFKEIALQERVGKKLYEQFLSDRRNGEKHCVRQTIFSTKKPIADVGVKNQTPVGSALPPASAK